MLKLTALFISLIMLHGCSSGILPNKRAVPNEFKVVSNPPLTLPPDYNLRPPKKAELNKANSSDVLFGSSSDKKRKITRADRQFLGSVGLSENDPTIRDILDRETENQIAEKEDKNIFEKAISFTRGDEDEGKDPVVDSLSERRRIEESEKEGEHPSEGDIKTIEKSGKKGLLNRVFGF